MDRSAFPDALLAIPRSELRERDSLSTAEEIVQQPGVWREVMTTLAEQRESLQKFLQPITAAPNARVIFCGAGTSAFIGDTIASAVASRTSPGKSAQFISASTTNIVANPDRYMKDKRKTLVVSFARSGDSPESIAAVNLAESELPDCRHLVITCNPQGRLAEFAERAHNAYTVLLPERTNDRGFAMTSSYSSMLAAGASIFAQDNTQLGIAADLAEQMIDHLAPQIWQQATASFDRLVVLGSGSLEGTAREVSLKCLELAGGKLMSISDTALGFRHGPKIVVSSDTVIIQLISNNPYTRKYDLDLLCELRGDGIAANIIALDAATLMPDDGRRLDDIWLSLTYIVYGQIFAFLKSYSLGINVDTPCPSGEVNRVVQGVTIHPFA